MKIVHAGLQMRSPGLPPSVFDSVIHGTSSAAPWGNLEPTEGAYQRAVVDHASAIIAFYNTKHSKSPRQTILRMDANTRVPQWLYALTGGGVKVSSPGHAGPPQTGDDARWWTPIMQHRHLLLMEYFGPIIDASPEIARVTVCGPDEIYDEVFVRFSGNAPGLAAAGLTTANDEASFFAYVDNMCHTVRSTSIMLDVSQYQVYQGSLAFTKKVVDHLIANAAVKPTLAQASLHAANAHTDPVYAFMKGYGPKGSKQCVLRMQMEPSVAGADFLLCGEAAIGYGVSELEVSTDYSNQSLATLAALDNGLRANAI